MSDETIEKRCKFCRKLLINEKILFCRRCKLEGRNKVGQVGGIAASMFAVILSAKAFAGNKENDDFSSA